MVGPKRPLFVLFGSSIVQFGFGNQGWAAILADVYSRSADIVMRGYAGWNSRLAVEVLDQVFPKDASRQPSLVIVYFGGNDSVHPLPSGLGPHVPLPEYVDNMRKIAMHLKSLSKETRVIFLTAPPINEKQIQESPWWKLGGTMRTNESCRIYSEACLKLCREIDVEAIDVWSAIQQRNDWLESCFTDGIHFTFVGSKIVAKEILKTIREADWEPNLYWKALPIEFPDHYNVIVGSDGEPLDIYDLELFRCAEWE